MAELKKKGKKLGWHNPKIRKALKAYWKIHKKPKQTYQEIKKVKEKKAETELNKADQFAENIMPALVLLIEQGLTLEQMAKELERLGVKTRWGNEKWSITQVARVRKRLGI